MAVYVYAPDADDLDNMGLCGALATTSCEHEEVAGSSSELTLSHPIDEEGRYRLLVPGVILKAPVPVRTVPGLTGTQIETSIETWTVSPLVTKQDRTLYNKATGKNKKAVKVLAGEQEIKITKRGDEWYKGTARVAVKSGNKTKHKNYSGYIKRSALLTRIDTQDILPTPAGIESAIPSVTVQDQLFRAYEVEAGDKGITVHARHISYDDMGNLTDYAADNPTLDEALQGIRDGCVTEPSFELFTDMSDRRVDVSYTRINPIKALLDPEEGVLARWPCELVRDNEEMYFLSRAGMDRGVRIEYGRNLLGVTYTLDWEGVATRILPVGEDDKGKPLYLSDGGISAAGSYVVSPREGDYPVPRVVELPVSEAKMDKQVNKALARSRMRDAAKQVLENGGDLPRIALKVCFAQLGDTEEYADFASLENVFLYDTVLVLHRKLGIEQRLDVVRTKFDCLRERFIETELGVLRDTVGMGALATWQVPSGLNAGRILLNGSVSTGQLGDESIVAEKIQSNTISAIHINAEEFFAGTVTAGIASIALAQLTTANIQTANIDWAQIANLAAQIAMIAAAQITAANIENANIQWAQIASLNASIASIARAQITTANINSADINWAEIASLQAGVAEMVQASIGSADINYARIKDMVSDTAIITTGAAGQLYINRLCVTEANMVSLTVGELMLKGEDGQFYKLCAGPDGTVTTQVVQVGGDNIAGNTISGSNLIENTITCRELNVGSIFADSAMIRAIKAANIDVADLFASSAYITALRTNIIQSDIGAALNISSNESILSRVTQEAYDAGIAELQATDESLSTTIEQTASGIAQCVTKGNLTRYLTFDVENGVLIGDTSASYKVQILSDRVNILQNGLAVAYFAAGRFYIMEGELTDSLTVGNYQIRKTADGGLAIG